MGCKYECPNGDCVDDRVFGSFFPYCEDFQCGEWTYCDLFHRCVEKASDCVATCTEELRCYNGQCLQSGADFCNGVNDCTDGSDELNVKCGLVIDFSEGGDLGSLIAIVLVVLVVLGILAVVGVKYGLLQLLNKHYEEQRRRYLGDLTNIEEGRAQPPRQKVKSRSKKRHKSSSKSDKSSKGDKLSSKTDQADSPSTDKSSKGDKYEAKAGSSSQDNEGSSSSSSKKSRLRDKLKRKKKTPVTTL